MWKKGKKWVCGRFFLPMLIFSPFSHNAEPGPRKSCANRSNIVVLCSTLWQSWRQRNVRSCFKVCATTPKNMQQHATGCANGRNMTHSTTLHPFVRGFRHGHESFLFTMQQFSHLVYHDSST